MSDTTAVTSDVKLCDSCGATFGEDDDKRYKDCSPCRTGDLKPHEPEATDHEVLTLDLGERKTIPAPPKKFYWCGVTSDAPWGSVTLGGINFQKTMGRVVNDGTGNQMFQDDTDLGVVHHLTDAQVTLVLEHVTNKSVRYFREDVVEELDGDRTVTKGDIISHKGSGLRPYAPMPGDIPIGCFVYMVKVGHRKDRPLENPPPLVDRDW